MLTRDDEWHLNQPYCLSHEVFHINKRVESGLWLNRGRESQTLHVDGPSPTADTLPIMTWVVAYNNVQVLCA